MRATDSEPKATGGTLDSKRGSANTANSSLFESQFQTRLAGSDCVLFLLLLLLLSLTFMWLAPHTALQLYLYIIIMVFIFVCCFFCSFSL